MCIRDRRFISGGMLSTAELSIVQARKEINVFAERTRRMFGMVRDLLHTTNDNDFNKLFSRIEKYENISDNMAVSYTHLDLLHIEFTFFEYMFFPNGETVGNST